MKLTVTPNDERSGCCTENILKLDGGSLKPNVIKSISEVRSGHASLSLSIYGPTHQIMADAREKKTTTFPFTNLFTSFFNNCLFSYSRMYPMLGSKHRLLAQASMSEKESDDQHHSTIHAASTFYFDPAARTILLCNLKPLPL